MKKGWEVKKLWEVVDKASSNISQNQLNDEKGEYAVYGAGGFIKNISFYHRDSEYISIVKDGAGIGRIQIQPAFSSVIGTLQYLIPKNSIDIKYLFYFLMGVDFLKYKNGSTIPHIYFKDYSQENILVPSLTEQRQIVAAIEKAFSVINKAKANAEKNLLNATQMAESYLENILTSNTNWIEKKLLHLTTKIGSGATPKGGNESYKRDGISLIRSMNVHDRLFKDNKLAFIDEKQAENLRNVTVEKNDILINITGASIARSCIVPDRILPARVNQHVSILRPRVDCISPRFLNLLLTSKQYKFHLLLTGEKGSTRQALTKVQLENVLVRYPPTLTEQKALEKQIETFREFATELQSIYQQKIAALEELKKSILEKAFKGELTEKTKDLHLADL